VPIIPNVNAIAKDGFIIIGSVRVEPDSVIIHGNEMLLKNIRSWSTQPIVLNNVYQNVTMPLALSDSLSQIVRISSGSMLFHSMFSRLQSWRLMMLRLEYWGDLN